MNARVLGRMICLCLAFVMMGGTMASAKDMPERPTWNDVRKELRNMKKHPKPVDVDKKAMAEAEGPHKGVPGMKPLQNDGKLPPPVPALDPRADKKHPKSAPDMKHEMGHPKPAPDMKHEPGHPKPAPGMKHEMGHPKPSMKHEMDHDKDGEGKLKKDGPKGKDHPGKMIHPKKMDHPKKMHK